MNQTLIDVHESIIPTLWLNDTEATHLLRAICDNSFEQ